MSLKDSGSSGYSSIATRRVALWAHPEILKVVSAIFDDQAVPCQTLNFMHGSQQAVHQDVIHLTPFPQGFMCGVWVALEDIHPDSGPLIVYPGSHRLPRLYAHTVGVEKVRDGSKWSEFSAVYAPKMKELIDQSGLEPFYYTPRAGSVLIWHENLAHGGSPRNNDELTRKSIVSHYFGAEPPRIMTARAHPPGRRRLMTTDRQQFVDRWAWGWNPTAEELDAASRANGFRGK